MESTTSELRKWDPSWSLGGSPSARGLSSPGTPLCRTAWRGLAQLRASRLATTSGPSHGGHLQDGGHYLSLPMPTSNFRMGNITPWSSPLPPPTWLPSNMSPLSSSVMAARVRTVQSIINITRIKNTRYTRHSFVNNFCCYHSIYNKCWKLKAIINCIIVKPLVIYYGLV